MKINTKVVNRICQDRVVDTFPPLASGGLLATVYARDT